MRRAVLFGALLASMSSAANAADCAVQWRALDAILSGADLTESAPARPVRASGGTSCTVSDLTLLPSASVSYRVRSLTWSGAGLDRFLVDGTPPSSVSLRMMGVRAVAQDQSAATRWVLERPGAAGQSALGIVAAWDPSGRLLIETEEFGTVGKRSVWADAAVDGVDLSSAASAKASAATFSVTALEADIGLDEAAARFLLTGLGAGGVRGSDDPGGAFDAFRREAEKTIDALPDAVFPVHSRVALKALLGDLPNPEGRLRAEITARQGFGAANLLPLLLRRADGDSNLAAAFVGLRADLRYDR